MYFILVSERSFTRTFLPEILFRSKNVKRAFRLYSGPSQWPCAGYFFMFHAVSRIIGKIREYLRKQIDFC